MDSTPISKAVILARGLGTRMRAEDSGVILDADQAALADAGLKTLVPITGDKTLLDFIFENLTAAGFTKICLVIGDEHDAIRKFCSDRALDISFAVQKEPLGTADAVLASEEFSAGDHFLAINSDNLYPVEGLRRLREAGVPGLVAFDRRALVEKSNIPEDRIAKFAEVIVDSEGFLKEILEKPEHPRADAAVSMNAWMFAPTIFDSCRAIGPSSRGEYEITDAVAYSINELGEKFMAIPSSEGVLDLSSRADVVRVEGLLSSHK